MGDRGGEPTSTAVEQEIEGPNQYTSHCHRIQTTDRGRMAESIHAVVLHDACLHMGRGYTRGGEFMTTSCTRIAKAHFHIRESHLPYLYPSHKCANTSNFPPSPHTPAYVYGTSNPSSLMNQSIISKTSLHLLRSPARSMSHGSIWYLWLLKPAVDRSYH